MFARSKTISVIPNSTLSLASGTASGREAESVRAAVQRAKERRKKPPPTKPLPYAASRKTPADTPPSSKTPTLSPSRPNVSPKKSLPLPPRNINRPTRSPGKSLLPTKTQPPPLPPTNPPSQFTSRSPPTASPAGDCRRTTVSSSPLRRHPPPRPPVPSTPPFSSQTKKRLSWGTSSKFSIHHSLPSTSHSNPSTSHSNSSTLNRGSPPVGGQRGLSTSGPLPRSTTIERSNPISKFGSEGQPLYEEINNWIPSQSLPMASRSLPPVPKSPPLSAMYSLRNRGRSSMSLEGVETNDRNSDPEDVDEYVDMQGFLSTEVSSSTKVQAGE